MERSGLLPMGVTVGEVEVLISGMKCGEEEGAAFRSSWHFQGGEFQVVSFHRV